VSDIKGFLLARVDEDEATARGSQGGAWTTGGLRMISQPEESKDWEPAAPGWVLVEPRHVLAECEAKRRIVERSGGNVCGGDSPTHYPQDYAEGCDGCAAAQSADYETHWVLALLASVYADHPDFDEGWRL
jgi:hypothetical protein